MLDTSIVAYAKNVVSFLDKKKKNKDAQVDVVYDKIDKNGNLMLYNALLQKLQSQPYINLSALKAQIDFLEEKRDSFEMLSVEDQCSLLSEIMHLFQCNSTSANLKLIGGVSSAGVLTCNKKLSETGECLLITQSPTGYYKNTVNLTAFYHQ